MPRDLLVEKVDLTALRCVKVHQVARVVECVLPRIVRRLDLLQVQVVDHLLTAHQALQEALRRQPPAAAL